MVGQIGNSGDAAIPEGGYVKHMIFVSCLGAGYIFCSSGLIAYNKFLMDEDRFPYAASLVLIHAVFCSCCAAILYLVKPSWFPSLSDPAKKVAIDGDLILKGAMPIAFFFSVQLVLSNTAYMHSSLAFLQMLKEANLVLVYVFSLIACLEKFSWRSVGVLGLVCFATALTIHGEVNFSWTGFCIQGISQLFECCKIVLQAVLLSSAGRKLDALTYVLIVMPICAVFLAGGIAALHVFPHEHFLVPDFHHLVQWWPHLLANACIAFVLNVVIALFIKYAAAVAFILAGILKDAMIVAVSAFFLKEVVTGIQTFGFALQLAAICLWSMIKTFPDRFENGIVQGFHGLVLGLPLAGKTHGEKTPYGTIQEGTKGA
jgi:hypothetical protein